MTYTTTITAKGPITIPRLARQALKTTTVEIEVKGEDVILKRFKVLPAIRRYI